MSKILILAKSGFGKSTSIGEIPELGIKGLDPTNTYLISCVNKPLPFRGASNKYKIVELSNLTITGFTNKISPQDPKFIASFANDLAAGNRLITNDASIIAMALSILSKSPFTNIVLDDMNYISQDYYMKNALKGGWDTAKIMGYNMGIIFDAINMIPESKNIICMAHYEEYKDKNGDSISYRYKSTGNMIDQYICPEGKFEIVLYGKTTFNEKEKRADKQFVTNDDGMYPAKSPIGMFDMYVPNDLGYIIDKVKEYYD